MTYRELMDRACEELRTGGCDEPRQEARELMGKALGADPRRADFGDTVKQEAEPAAARRFSELCSRRLKGEPLQYILGEWEFYGLTFKVGQGVLIPRQDTETLIETAEKLYEKSDSLDIIDLCAGSGCIGLTLEKRLKNARLTLVEKYPEAMSYLKENHRLHGSEAALVEGDVLDESLPESLERADLIVCNPPYLTAEDMTLLQREVTFEPETALFGGEDGLDFYRAVVRLWRRALKPGGRMLFEIGMGQEDEVMQLMVQLKGTQVRSLRDARGIFRCVTGVFEEEF